MFTPCKHLTFDTPWCSESRFAHSFGLNVWVQVCLMQETTGETSNPNQPRNRLYEVSVSQRPSVERATPHSICNCLLITLKGTPAQAHGPLNTIGGGTASQRSARGPTRNFVTKVAPILVFGRNVVTIAKRKRDAFVTVQTRKSRPPTAAVVVGGAVRRKLLRTNANY